MNGDPVVPEGTRSGSPLEPHLNVNIFLIDVVQVVQDEVALLRVKPNDRLGHGTVDPESLPASGGMYSHQWVDPLNPFGSSFWIVAVQIRVCADVHGLLSIDDLTEIRGELGIVRVVWLHENICIPLNMLHIRLPTKCRHRCLGQCHYGGE
jgi:hypothetical protein